MKFKYNIRKAAFYFVIFIITVGFRIYISFGTNLPHYTPDSRSYFSAADKILHFSDWQTPYFPPGFPFLIALLDYLGPRETCVLGAQILLSTATALMTASLVWLMTRRHWITLLAFLLIALWPNQLNQVRYLLSGTLASFCLLGSIFFLILKKDRLWALALSGCLLGAAVLTRTTIGPSIYLILGASFVQRSIKQGTKNSCFIFGAFLLVVSPVILLNYLSDNRITISRNTAPNLIIAGEFPSYDMQWRSEEFEPNSPVYLRTKTAVKMYFNRARQSPGTFWRFRLISFWELWGPWPLGERHLFNKIFIGPPRFVLFVSAVAGTVFMVRRKYTREACFLFGPVCVVSLVHIFTFSNPRYSYIMEPLCLVLGAFAVFHFFEHLKHLSRGPKRAYKKL